MLAVRNARSTDKRDLASASSSRSAKALRVSSCRLPVSSRSLEQQFGEQFCCRCSGGSGFSGNRKLETDNCSQISRSAFMVGRGNGNKSRAIQADEGPAKDAIQFKGDCLGTNHHEGAARSWRSLRASNETLESEDEGIYLRRTQRHLHH